jgi:hypothetical protein
VHEARLVNLQALAAAKIHPPYVAGVTPVAQGPCLGTAGLNQQDSRFYSPGDCIGTFNLGLSVYTHVPAHALAHRVGFVGLEVDSATLNMRLVCVRALAGGGAAGSAGHSVPASGWWCAVCVCRHITSVAGSCPCRLSAEVSVITLLMRKEEWCCGELVPEQEKQNQAPGCHRNSFVQTQSIRAELE